MRELVLQRDGDWLKPFDPESLEQLRGYYQNQPIRAKCTGIKKPRSYQQLKAYHKSCKIVSENHPDFTSKEEVDFQTRVELKFFNRFVAEGNKVYVECRSISYAELDHAEANNIFDRAFALHAKWLGITKDELLKEAEGVA